MFAEEASTNEIREEVVGKSAEVDSGAGETSSEVGKPVHEASPTRTTGCTWDVGVEAPSPGSSQQNMSIGSSIEAENEPLEQAMEKKENNKWRLNVESDKIEKLEEHVKYERDSKVFKYCSSATGKISNPIKSVDAVVRQGNSLVLDVSIDSKQFGIGFTENSQNWPTFVTNVKRVSRL